MYSKYINIYNRVDLIVKLLYIDAYITSKDYNYYKNLYLKHIKYQNWFMEWDKKSEKDFLSHFNKLIDSMKNHNFDNRYPIILWENNTLLDGAHRFACSIYLKIEPIFEEKNEKWINWPIEWFIKNHFTQDEIINIIKKLKELTKSKLLILWPTSKLDNQLKDFCKIDITFEKNIHLKELIYDLYSYDNKIDIWIENKAFTISKYKKISLLITQDNTDKTKLRNKLINNVSDKVPDNDKFYYTFHSGDDFKEDKYIERIVLSNTYYNQLKLRSWYISESLQKFLFNKELKLIKNQWYCIVWSWPIGVFNDLKVSDIDLISQEIIKWWERIIKHNSFIDILNYQYFPPYTNKELINKHSFIYRWFNFLSLNILKERKLTWLREKDIKQWKLISSILKDNNNATISIFKQTQQKLKFIKIKIFIKIINTWILVTKKLHIYEKVSYLWRKYILKNFR